MPKSWKGLDGSRLWCIFPDGRCHFVFCINWLNLLALCTYFRGNHSLLSIGQKSSLALESSWSGEGGMVKGLFWGYAGVIPNFLRSLWGRRVHQGIESLLPTDISWLCEQVTESNCAGELLKASFFQFFLSLLFLWEWEWINEGAYYVLFLTLSSLTTSCMTFIM